MADLWQSPMGGFFRYSPRFPVWQGAHQALSRPKASTNFEPMGQWLLWCLCDTADVCNSCFIKQLERSRAAMCMVTNRFSTSLRIRQMTS
jgi:hypothetical protein